MRDLLLGIALAVSLAACAANTAADQSTTTTTAASGTGAGSDSEMICTEEKPTGSSIPREVCRTRAQVEADRKGAIDMLGQPRVTPSRGN